MKKINFIYCALLVLFIVEDLSLGKRITKKAAEPYPTGQRRSQTVLGKEDDHEIRVKTERLLQEGNDLLAQKRWQEGVQKFYDVLDIEPTNMKARMHLMISYLRVLDYSRAVNEIKLTGEDDEGQRSILYTLGREIERNAGLNPFPIYEEAARQGILLNPYQRPIRLIPELRSQPIWEISAPWIKSLEKEWKTFREEYHKVKNHLKDYSEVDATDIIKERLISGKVLTYEFYDLGEKVEQSAKDCPQTAQAIENIGPDVTTLKMSQSRFHVVLPNTATKSFCNPFNYRLVLHLPLVLPAKSGYKYRVGPQHLKYKLGKAIIFDDSYETEESNTSDSDVVILSVMFWHPDTTQEIRKEIVNSYHNYVANYEKGITHDGRLVDQDVL